MPLSDQEELELLELEEKARGAMPQQAHQAPAQAAPQAPPISTANAAMMGFSSGSYGPEIGGLIDPEAAARAEPLYAAAREQHPYVFGAMEYAPWLIPGGAAVKLTGMGIKAGARAARPMVRAGIDLVRRNPEVAADVAGFFTTGVPFIGSGSRLLVRALRAAGRGSRRVSPLEDVMKEAPKARRTQSMDEYIKHRGTESTGYQRAQKLERMREIDQLAERRPNTINLFEDVPPLY